MSSKPTDVEVLVCDYICLFLCKNTNNSLVSTFTTGVKVQVQISNYWMCNTSVCVPAYRDGFYRITLHILTYLLLVFYQETMSHLVYEKKSH